MEFHGAKTYEIFHGDFVGFRVKYTPWNWYFTWNSTESPWKISYVSPPWNTMVYKTGTGPLFCKIANYLN